MSLGQAGAGDEQWSIIYRGDTADDQVYFTATSAGGGSDTANKQPGYTTDSWDHVAAVERIATWRQIYVNAAAGTANTASNEPGSSDSIWIGSPVVPGGGDHFDGEVFWPAAYSIDLSVADLARGAAGFEPIFIQRHALKFYARLLGDEDLDIIGGVVLTPVTGGTGPTVTNEFPTTMIRALPRGRGRDRHRFT